MEQRCRWSVVALAIMAVILQGPSGRVGADVLRPQLAPPSPEFVRYRASLQSRSGAVDTGLVPSPVDRSHLEGRHITWQGSDTPLPASYDLRAEGRVTGVRDQGTSSACWTFATYGSLESTMLPAETLDFSENNLKNASGFDYGPNWGGNGDMATAYLTRWSGPIAEEDDPYDPDSTASLPDLSPIRHVQKVMILPKRPGPLDTADIKRAIVDYGALVGSMCWTGDGSPDTAYYKLSTSAYYYTGSAESNHVITVVGWDDAFPASSFSTRPPGNGAWIVKNSWGTAWGQSGYYFMSYYDAVLFKKSPAYCFLAAEPTTNYKRVYQYDPLGQTYSFGYGTRTAWAANVFVAEAAENVRAIGFYTLDVNCSYEARVYGSWNGSTFSDLLSSTTGTIPAPGYHTVVLPSSGAPVASGQTFGVVVKLVMTTDYPYPIALEKPVPEYSMGATASTGQSYMSSDGVSWADVTERYAHTNVCVKAYAGTPSTTAILTCQVSPAGTGSVSVSPPSADRSYRVGTVVTLAAAPAAGWRFVGWTDATQDATDPLKATVTMDDDKSVTATFTAVDYGEPKSTHTWLDYPAGTGDVHSYAVDVRIDAFPSDPDPGWLYYFALQTDFIDGGGAHGGLQWASGGRKANWGGSDLRWAGDTQSIVADQSWTIGTWYRYQVVRGAQQPDNTWAWGFWITDLSTDTRRYVGDITSKGSSISSCAVWMETGYGVVATTPRAQVRWRNPVYTYGSAQTPAYPVAGQVTYNGTCVEPHTTDQQLVSASPREWIQLTNAPVRTTLPSSHLWKDQAFTLTTTASPSAGGTVTRSPDAASYPASTVVTLTATPAVGYTLVGWSGDLSGPPTNPPSVTMDANKTVTASFAAVVKKTIELRIGSGTMLVDGRPVVLEAAPVILNSRTLLPIRAVVEAVGGTIAWEASTRKVTIVRNTTTLELWIGRNVAQLDGRAVTVDSDAKVVPLIMNGRTLLPLRFVAEALALDVQWNAASKTVTITWTP